MTPQNRYPKFELLQFTKIFESTLDTKSIRDLVDATILLLMDILRTEDAVRYYRDYLKDVHPKLCETLSQNALNNRLSVEVYNKHFVKDYAQNDPDVTYNVAMDHFLLDDDIKRIVNDMGYHTREDLIKAKFNSKVLYRDAKYNDIPPWMTNSNSRAMLFNTAD